MTCQYRHRWEGEAPLQPIRNPVLEEDRWLVPRSVKCNCRKYPCIRAWIGFGAGLDGKENSTPQWDLNP